MSVGLVIGYVHFKLIPLVADLTVRFVPMSTRLLREAFPRLGPLPHQVAGTTDRFVLVAAVVGIATKLYEAICLNI